MNYKEANEYISSLKPFGMKLGLEPVQALLGVLGNPEKELRCIHVAGSNGKGSVTVMLGSVLASAGYRVGLSTSPHLVELRERISISGELISEEKFTELAVRIKAACQEIVEKGVQHPTYFEFVTAMAFLYFKDEDVDLAVIEVGLGGRLDATNVIDPILTIITSISLEHTFNLGNTLAEIAWEKAGIVKKDRNLVVATRVPEALDIIERVAANLGAEVFKSWELVEIKRKGGNHRCQIFNAGRHPDKCLELELGMLGRYQLDNARTALATIERLRVKGFNIPEEAVREGLEKVRWPGRLEVMRESPLVVLDCAHNPEGMLRLAESLPDFDYKELYVVLGILSNKDIPAIIAEIVPKARLVIATQAKSERAMPAGELAGEVEKHGVEAEIKPDIGRAVELALSKAGVEDLVLVTGSIYTVGEARDWILKGRKRKNDGPDAR